MTAMPSNLPLTPQDIDTPTKRSKYTLTIVGCGPKGLLYANLFADAGFNVLCTDTDASIIRKAAKGKTTNAIPEAETKLKNHPNQEKITLTTELKHAVSKSKVVIITLPTKADEQKKNNNTTTINTCKQIGAALHPGTLVVYGSIASVGFIEGTVKELLENTSALKTGQTFSLAYSPLMVTTNQTDLALTVAATDKFSLSFATTILQTLTNNIKEIPDLKTLEIATLFTITKQDTLLALTNEFAVFCENTNADYFKVLDALNLNVPCFRPTITDQENCADAYLLLEDAENLNLTLKLPTLARQINEEMVKHAVNLTQTALRSCGKTLRRGRVAILGSSPARDSFVRLIEQKGAKVTVYEPLANKKETLELNNIKTSLNKTVEGTDCIIILDGQEPFSRFNLKKLKPLLKPPPMIVDLAGKFDPSQVTTEGFIYFGLARGNDKK
ncbi:MAG: hypothetical protein LBQ98_07650 [Nitrososphaerota archaeon]|jgi:UDP-N-acetyl-D-galactosamine dehydrogenase|nr:hypothetical protein [Nitrososphaerota archaeon]